MRWEAAGKNADLCEAIIKQLLWRFEEADYYSLDLQQRQVVLQLLLDGHLHRWNLGDAIGMKAVTLVPEEQQKNWLEALVTNKQLKPLFSKVDGDEFSEMIMKLSGFVLKHYPRPVSFTPEEAALKGRYILFQKGLFTGYALNQWLTDEGYISLYSRPQFTVDPKAAYSIKATDWVYVDFKSGFAFNEAINFAKGARIPMPALLAYALFNEENNRRLWQSGKLALDVALLFTGIGELNAAMKAGTALEKAVRITKAVTDLGVAIGDITISHVLADKLDQTKEGREFLSTWNTITLYYGIGSVSTEIGLYAKKLYQQKKVLQQLEGSKALSEEVKEELDKITKDIEVKTGVVDEVIIVSERTVDAIVEAFRRDLPNSWRYNKIGDDAVDVLDGTGKKWATIYKDKIVAPGRTTIGTSGNPVLNKVPLVKNMLYEVDGFLYYTDDLGRVLKTNADLDDIVRVRLGNQQIKAVDVKDGIRGSDQGGHIIGSRFFGPGEQINLYPQSAALNQGAWKQMENTWAEAMVQGKDVRVEVRATYNGTSARPINFEVEYWIDGSYNFREFVNQ
jgi:hypothetical protein